MPRIIESRCPYCNYLFDSASHLKDETMMPKPGDITVCINCADVLVFDDELKPRQPTSVETTEIAKDPEIDAAITQIKIGLALIKRRN